MAAHPYLRFLARVSARQPLLRPPPDGSLTQISPSDFFSLMSYTFPISGYRSRSFELRRLELHVADLSATEQQATSPSSSPSRAETGSPQRHPGSPSATAADTAAGAAVCTAPGPTPHLASAGSGVVAGQHPHPHYQADQSSFSPPPPPPAPPTDHPSPSAQPPPSSPSPPLLSPPPHSYMEVRYPFTGLPWLWHQYHRPGFPGLDPALIIEDFDTFAADVAARHVGHVPDSMLVTAFLERLTWHVHLRPGDGLVPAAAADGGGGGGNGDGRRLLAPLAPTDLRLAGQVTWVGRSSMEVLLQLTTAEAPALAAAAAEATAGPAAAGGTADGLQPSTLSSPPQSLPSWVALPPGHLVATAEFVMALRDRSLRRAVDVPPLHPRDDLERELFQRGREHQRQRQARRDRDRDAAMPALGRGASPSRGGSPPPAVDLAVAAPPESELPRMLYDNILLSDFARSLPTDAGALRLLEPDAALEPPLGQEPEPEPEQGQAAGTPQPGEDCIRPAKRPRAHGGERSEDGGTCSNLNYKFLDTATTAAVAASTAPTPVRQTEVHRTVIAEFQDRNTSGTVFGGHLLRLAYEHAATAAAVYAGGPCELLWMEEGAISSPARVGDVLHAVARVVWSEPGGRALRVVVRVGKYLVSAPSQHVLALTLTAAFLAPPPTAAPAAAAARDAGREHRPQSGLCAVVPTTLTEAGEALAAQRRHEATMAALARAEEEAGDGRRGATGGQYTRSPARDKA